MRTLLRRAAPFIGILLWTGCAHHGSLRPQPEILENEYASLYRKVAQSAPKLQTLSGLAELTVRRGKGEQTVDAVLLIGSPDRLYMEFSGPLGISLGAVSITEGDMRVVNQRDGSWWEGPVTTHRLAGLGIPTDSVPELVALLLEARLPPPIPTDGTEWKYDESGVFYQIRRLDEKGEQIWEIDPNRFTILNYRRKLDTGWLIAEYSAERLEDHPRLGWPKRIGLLAPGAALDLEFDQVAPNPPLGSADFDVMIPESFVKLDRIGDLFGP